MRSHFFTALLALVITACASHHRDVASVQEEPGTTDPSARASAESISARGDRGIR